MRIDSHLRATAALLLTVLVGGAALPHRAVEPAGEASAHGHAHHSEDVRFAAAVHAAAAPHFEASEESEPESCLACSLRAPQLLAGAWPAPHRVPLVATTPSADPAPRAAAEPPTGPSRGPPAPASR